MKWRPGSTRSFALLVGGLLLWTAALDAQAVRYATTAVRLRADASTASRIVTIVPRGARVAVRACAVDWCWVDFGGRTGYVAESYLAQRARPPKRAAALYTNARGERVRAPLAHASEAPAGATAQCRDGTYSFSRTRQGTCSHHGGVAVWL